MHNKYAGSMSTEYQEQNGPDASCEPLPGLQAACFHLIYTPLCWVQNNVDLFYR